MTMWLLTCAEPGSLRSDTSLEIPWHVRRHLHNYEACVENRMRLAQMGMQIAVLRAIGEIFTSFHSQELLLLLLTEVPEQEARLSQLARQVSVLYLQ